MAEAWHVSEPTTEVAELLELAAMGRPEPPITIAVLAPQPALLKSFLGWAAALALHGGLPKRDHELLALRASHNCGSRFEWDEHAAFARNAGMTDREIDAVAHGPDTAGWDPNERALLTAADELNATGTITPTTRDELSAHYDAAALAEIVYVVGQYTMLSYVANAFGD
jgi:alkylhydroperoxidase family enzyme